MGIYLDLITEESEKAKKIARSRNGFSGMWSNLKNLPTDIAAISKRPNTDPLRTGDFESLRKWLLQMVDDAKTIDRLDYLRKDAYVGIYSLEKLEKNMRDVQKGTPSRYVSVKAVQKQMDSGCTPDKVHKHVQWMKSTYLPAISKRRKELKKDLKESFEFV